jgi:hypothetical protein
MFLGVCGHDDVVVGVEVLKNSNHVWSNETSKSARAELIQHDEALALRSIRVELLNVAAAKKVM